MWQYFWAHAVYHLIRWFPQDNRWKARIVVVVFTVAMLVPQIYVLSLSDTGRYCSQPLLNMLIVSMVFTFCIIGFAVLFIIMEPIPWEVKLVFQIFGAINFIVAILLIAFTAQASSCASYTAGLYYFSVAAMVISAVTLFYFLVVVPFWIINKVCKNKVLDRAMRDGICYEPVKCCSCVWHI